MEPLERAARALAADLGKQDLGTPFVLDDNLALPYLDQGEVDFGRLARAVLEAIREPSEGMRDAVEKMLKANCYYIDCSDTEIWQTMIDAILTPC